MSEQIFINPAWFKKCEPRKETRSEKKQRILNEEKKQQALKLELEIESLNPNQKELLNLILSKNKSAGKINVGTVRFCGTMYSQDYYRFSENISVHAKIWVIFLIPIFVSKYYLFFGNTPVYEINKETIEALVPGMLNRYLKFLIPGLFLCIGVAAILFIVLLPLYFLKTFF